MIISDINREIDEINEYLSECAKTRGQQEIAKVLTTKLEKIRQLTNEQHLLLNARLSIEQPSQPSNCASYAQAVKSKITGLSSSFNTQPVKYTCFIAPKNTSHDFDPVKELKNNVNALDLDIRVNRLKSTKSGTIILDLADKSSLEKLENALSGSDSLRLKKQTKIDPYVKLMNITEDLSDETVLNVIKSKYRIDEATTNLRIAFQSKIKDTNQRNMIIQASSSVWSNMISDQFLNIAWNRVKMVNYVPTQRCFKCQCFGHSSKKCKATRNCCSWCSGTHDVKSCKSSLQNGLCSNCKKCNQEFKTTYDTWHPTTSNQCPIYLKYKQRISDSINYNGNQ